MKKIIIIMVVLGGFFKVSNDALFARMLQVSHVDSATLYLYNIMDKFHNTVDVYTEQDAGGNVYFPSGWMGDQTALTFKEDCLDNPCSGLTCIEIEFKVSGNNWAGIYWQYPEFNWGTMPGYDLSGATTLSFYARGKNGNEKVEFFVAGVNSNGAKGPYKDPAQLKDSFTLSTTWQMYTFSLQGMDLQSIIGGFGFATSAAMNSGQDIIFYLDNIQFDKSRLDEPRLLLSYEQSKFKEDYYEDAANRNSAYVYDNALSMMALMRDTLNLESEDWDRAKLIGDAFLLCRDNDRYFHDGRLRNGYMTGDIIYQNTTRMPGWWDSTTKQWYENEYTVSSYTTNMAWAMIAWLWYHKYKNNPAYLEAAEELGNWIHDEMYDDTSGISGYRRGFWGNDNTQIKFTSKATEDNIVLYSAFKMLYKITGDSIWKSRSRNAKNFVMAMWSDKDCHFWAGSQDDGSTLLTDVIPLNIQTLAFLNFKSNQTLCDKCSLCINWASENCWVKNCYNCSCTFSGYDINDDLDGIWFGGTAQMALVYKYLGDFDKAEQVLQQIRNAQKLARNADNKGIVESCHDSVKTGYYDPNSNQVYKNNRLHIGATAWYICAEAMFNPTKVKMISDSELPVTYSLLQNYPNPFNAKTVICYLLSEVSDVELTVYNLTGQKVTTLVSEKRPAGAYQAVWDAHNATSGIYLYTLAIGKRIVQSRKVVLLK